jgi:predicted regulator of Ras-like GTPase activity (Roadblock/LC7/MglB family)
VDAVNERQQRLQAMLKQLVAQPGIVGAALVSRDGIRVMDLWKREIFNKETFSAMSATLMGAAEIALAETGGAKARRVIAETSGGRMAVVGSGGELVLVALGDASLPLDKFLAAVEGAADLVPKIVVGE